MNPVIKFSFVDLVLPSAVNQLMALGLNGAGGQATAALYVCSAAAGVAQL